jgi:hypothetical protein
MRTSTKARATGGAVDHADAAVQHDVGNPHGDIVHQDQYDEEDQRADADLSDLHAADTQLRGNSLSQRLLEGHEIVGRAGGRDPREYRENFAGEPTVHREQARYDRDCQESCVEDGWRPAHALMPVPVSVQISIRLQSRTLVRCCRRSAARSTRMRG